MPNIFDGIRKMSDDELSLQIAMFEQINIMNVAKETGNRVLAGFADLANSFVKAFSQGSSLEYEVTRVADRVKESIVVNKGRNRDELLELLKQQIFQKLGVDENQRADISEEKLTFMMVNEAGAVYYLEKYDTSANKIEELCIQYNKAFLQTLHNILLKQTPREADETDKQLQKRLDEVPIEVKRDVQRSIYPKEFSGRGIGRVLRLERGTKNLNYVITYLGIEAFDYIQVHISAAFSAIRPFKRMSSVLFAQLISKARQSYGVKFTINDSILPSFLESDKQAEFLEKEAVFREHLKAHNEADSLLNKCKASYEKNEEQLKREKERLDNVTEEESALNDKFKQLDSEKDKYVNNMMPENETKRYYSDVNDTKRRLDRAQEQCERQQKKVHDLEVMSLKLKTEYENMLIDNEEQSVMVDNEIREFAAQLRSKWIAFYYKFTFADNLFTELVKGFSSDDWLYIERMLKEVHDSKDLTAYESKPGEIYCMISKGKTAIIKINEACIMEII